MNPAANYILEKPEPFRSILLHLQAVIEHTYPDMQLLYKWRIPCFYIDGKTPFCYLNVSKNYVDLGFWQGDRLLKNTEHLVSEKRRKIKSLRYFSLEEIDEAVLLDVLKEAYSYKDESFYK